MATDDASSADMRPPSAASDADPLALDEETVERLLAGDLPPDQAPSGYAEVAALMAAASAPARPSELAGKAEALAELRAVTRARLRPARARKAKRRSRRRRVGLAVAVVTCALASGGLAAAAGGHLPGPLRERARSILVSVGAAEPTTPTTVPVRAGAGGVADRPEASGSTRPGSGPAGAGPVAGPGKEGLCQAYLASRDHNGKNMDATAFRLLAEAAGGSVQIPAYCQDKGPGKAEPEDHNQTPPDDPAQGQGQGQGGPPGDDNGGGDQGQGGPPSTRSPR